MRSPIVMYHPKIPIYGSMYMADETDCILEMRSLWREYDLRRAMGRWIIDSLARDDAYCLQSDQLYYFDERGRPQLSRGV